MLSGILRVHMRKNEGAWMEQRREERLGKKERERGGRMNEWMEEEET